MPIAVMREETDIETPEHIKIIGLRQGFRRQDHVNTVGEGSVTHGLIERPPPLPQFELKRANLDLRD
jgi:hypothetical protein